MSFLTKIKAIAERSEALLVEDFVGASALFVILMVGLFLPSFV